jgi:drug/metabolite transporter (DMT)-like permease
MRLMIIFCAVLGMQQIAIKAAAVDMSPMLQIGLRSGGAVLLIGMYLHHKGFGLFPEGGKLMAGIAAGILFTIEYFFVAEGLRFTNASHMVTMLYTAPAFAALGLHVLIPDERLRPVQWVGLILAFSGIAVAFFERSEISASGFDEILLGDFLGLLAGMSWGATTVVIRTQLYSTPPAQTLFIQLLTCVCLMVPAAALTGRLSFTMTGVVWASLIFQVLLVCVFGMLLWFWLLTVYPASQLGVLSFLTPVFGIVFGVVFLGENVEFRFALGAVMVLAGIALVSGWQWFQHHLFRVPDRVKSEIAS